MDDYDVFLNHRGPDVKGGFIAHLHETLRSAGLNPFLDKKSLMKGGPAFGSIDAALEVAKVHVAVVSKGYAESKYCLSELVAMMRSGKPVIPVFYDVEPAHLRRVEEGPFAAAFKKHKLRESAEHVQQWADALRELADITGFCFHLSDYKGDEAELKQEVVDSILSLMPTNDAFVKHHLVGVEKHVEICIDKITMMSSSTGILGLFGMGGIGKTSLAKEIYNHFIDHKIFKSMSFLEIDRTSPSSMEVGPSLLSKLQKQLLCDLLCVPNNNQKSYRYWFQKLSRQGPVLIVLDDIHNKSQFDQLILSTKLLAPGSCIILTSNDRHLLKAMARETNFYSHEVTTLGCNDSEKLFNWHAFGDEEAPENFKTLAQTVSQACGGLPLALKVVGLSLFDKITDEDKECIWPEAIDALKGDPDIMSALRWSYDCLLESEKLMFLDISCVFYGWRKQEAIEIWKGCTSCASCCGSGTPHISLQKLIDKSLIEVKAVEGRYTLAMHGLLRDIGQRIGMFDGSHLEESKASNMLEERNHGANKVRALNLANGGTKKLDIENFAKMPHLHFLILDGCDVSGNIGSISKELRWLRWRYMPLTHPPPFLNFSKLISLDFSHSTKLNNTWAKSNSAFEACPNLLRLDLTGCTSITTLPDSIGRLSRLQKLHLSRCENLQKLPCSIGQLTALQELILNECRRLEALPDTITSLSTLRWLSMLWCTSISKLPTSIGLMTSLIDLRLDLSTEGQAVAIGQCNALQQLTVTDCTDDAISLLDSSGALSNLDQLSDFWFCVCSSMTKLPETIWQLTNLNHLELDLCEKVQKLSDSIGQLKLLKVMELKKCTGLEALPESLGELTSLQRLWIVQCTSITKLPTSIGHLTSLRVLLIEGCTHLQSLPDISLRQLDALELLRIIDCGSSLEGLGALRMLQGLRIWGCTVTSELPGSCLMVMNLKYWHPDLYDDYMMGYFAVQRNLKELRVVEINGCGMLRHVQEDTENGRLILQRVYFDLPCAGPCAKVIY